MIRAFTPEDLEEVLQIWKQSNRQAHRFLPPYFWEQRCHQVKAALLQEEVFMVSCSWATNTSSCSSAAFT